MMDFIPLSSSKGSCSGANGRAAWLATALYFAGTLILAAFIEKHDDLLWPLLGAALLWTALFLVIVRAVRSGRSAS